ncbi:YdcF family protein [Candidatus Gracilibacteria bacterium]|nr:YdcF family protein [Candidatus Gracilibacteria bacterium]
MADYILRQGNSVHRIIFSGGKTKGSDSSEAELMKNYVIKRLIEKGFDLQTLEFFTEEDSLNTRINLENSFGLCRNEDHELSIFSSVWHLKRVKTIAELILDGIDGINFIDAESQHAKNSRYERNFSWQYLQFKSQIKEKIAIVIEKSKLLILLKDQLVLPFK